MANVKTWDELTRAQRVVRWESAVKALAALTRHEREKHFDMGTWANKTDCGTVGCAAGFCGLNPNIRRQGFKIVWNKQSYKRDDGSEASYWDWYWSMDPSDFYGEVAYEKIFTNTDYTGSSGKDVYKEVMGAMRAYLKHLKHVAKHPDEDEDEDDYWYN